MLSEDIFVTFLMSEEGENPSPQQTKTEEPAAQKEEAPKGISVHIGNLPFEYTEAKLKEIFGKYGEVLDSKIPTNPAGRSRGYGFVSFALKEDAQKAVDELNNKEMEGRKVEVAFAKGDKKSPRSDRRDRKPRDDRRDYDRRRADDDRYYRDDRRDRDRYSRRYEDDYYDRRRYDDDYDRRSDRRDYRRDDYDRRDRRYDDYDRRYDERRYDDDRRRRDDDLRRDYGRDERY